MNRLPILLLLFALLAYVPTASAYTTSLNVVASANAAYGSQSYDADSKLIDNINSPSSFSVNALYQVPSTSGPGSYVETYRSSAGGLSVPAY
ncbi:MULTISPECIES: hypothetical protein [Methylomonas]|nr:MULTISPECIES: hypothetical protein [Methylomonas]